MNELVRELLALPPQASTVAPEIDLLHYTIIGVTMLGATLIAGAAVWFTIRYRTGRVGGAPGDPVPRRTVSLAVELGLVAALAGFFVGAWVVGRRQYDVLREPPDDALEVWVVAKQWMWEFTYAEPHGLEHDLVVPAGRAVKLVLMSRDVIHSFYVPAFRVKMDAVPGRTTTVWFEASEPGTYPILCAEYCGTEHSLMRGRVVVLGPEDYQRWLTRTPAAVIAGPLQMDPADAPLEVPPQPLELVDLGARVAASEGCLRCHTTDGSPHIAPSFAGLFGRTIALQDGRAIVADEEYLTRSMMDPQAEIHAGYPAVMPSYRGRLDPGRTAALVELVRSLADVERWDEPPAPAVPELGTTPHYPPPRAAGSPRYPAVLPIGGGR